MPGNAETDGIRAAQWQKFAASGSIYDYLDYRSTAPQGITTGENNAATHRLICCLYSILQACQKIKIYFALIFTPQIRSKSILGIPRMRAILYCLVLKKTINTKTKHTKREIQTKGSE